jgi:hypothetical protein
MWERKKRGFALVGGPEGRFRSCSLKVGQLYFFLEDYTMTAANPFMRRDNSTSSMFKKLDATLREKVNRAIADRSPPMLQSVYETFDLKNRGISFSAFYRYARRLREQTTELQTAELAGDEGVDIAASLPTLLGRRFVDQLLYNEDLTAVAIARLTGAYTRLSRTRRQFPGVRPSRRDNPQRLQEKLQNAILDSKAETDLCAILSESQGST